MGQEAVTREDLANALEVMRKYVAAMGAMVVATTHNDFNVHYEKFTAADANLVQFLAALRGEN